MGEAKRRRQAAQHGQVSLPQGEALYRDLNIPLPAGMPSLPPRLQGMLTKLAAEARQRTGELLLEGRRAGDGRAIAERIVAIASDMHRLYLDMETRAFASEEGSRLAGEIACRKSCNWCCYLHVQTTVPEVFAIALGIRPDDPRRRRISDTAAEMQNLNELTRYGRKLPCPLLVDGACSVYDARPTVCRGHYSNSVTICEEDIEAAGAGRKRGIQYLALTQLIANAVSAGILRGLADHRLQAEPIELTEALALLLDDATALDRWLAGQAVFTPYR